MKKQVLIICTSLRNGSNSEALANAFAQGAQAAGHQVEKICLRGKTIDFCRGCLSCQHTGRCVISDDASEIVEKMRTADVLVFATPVYYYEMCGQMKTLLDRANPLFGSDYAFEDVYLLATAADTDTHAIDGAVYGLKGWISCFERARLAGTVFGGGVDVANAMAGHAALAQATKMGQSI